MGTPLSLSSFTKLIKGMVNHNPSLNDMNSASVMLRATSVCNFEVHAIGHPANVMTNPVLDLAVDESRCDVSTIGVLVRI